MRSYARLQWIASEPQQAHAIVVRAQPSGCPLQTITCRTRTRLHRGLPEKDWPESRALSIALHPIATREAPNHHLQSFLEQLTPVKYAEVSCKQSFAKQFTHW